jgi:hypothetical protein
MARAVKVMPVMQTPPRVFPTAPPMPTWVTEPEPVLKVEESKEPEVSSTPTPAPKLKPLSKTVELKGKSPEPAPVNTIGEV